MMWFKALFLIFHNTGYVGRIKVNVPEPLVLYRWFPYLCRHLVIIQVIELKWDAALLMRFATQNFQLSELHYDIEL